MIKHNFIFVELIFFIFNNNNKLMNEKNNKIGHNY